MRERRDTNRQRQRDGLRRDGEPAPSGFQSQGSYAHRTMVQQPDKDYDIDDGTYFGKDDLKGPRGGDKTARDAKEMVRKALHDDRFNKPPEVRTNCVRVYYSAGYHVDVPVYRKVTTTGFLRRPGDSLRDCQFGLEEGRSPGGDALVQSRKQAPEPGHHKRPPIAPADADAQSICPQPGKLAASDGHGIHDYDLGRGRVLSQ